MTLIRIASSLQFSALRGFHLTGQSGSEYDTACDHTVRIPLSSLLHGNKGMRYLIFLAQEVFYLYTRVSYDTAMHVTYSIRHAQVDSSFLLSALLTSNILYIALQAMMMWNPNDHLVSYLDRRQRVSEMRSL